MNWREINENRKVANEELYIEISDELNIPVEKVKEIIKAQSDMALKTIQTGGLESFIFPYLGKIMVNFRRAQKVHSLKKKNEIIQD